MANEATIVTLPYEVLIRYVNGVFYGAHQRRLRRITIDGEPPREEELPPEPLGINDFPTSALMDEATKAALAVATDLRAEVSSLKATIEEKNKQIASLTADTQRHRQEREDSGRNLKRLLKKVDDQGGQMVGLQAQVNELLANAPPPARKAKTKV